MPSYKIPVIAGPTASGKTAVAVELCRRIGGEIISADSMQVYRHLSVGTAKPTPDELLGIPCHLIDHVNPDEQYHMGRFVDEALRCIDEIRERGNVPVICGGTGLYIKGLLYGIFHGGETDMTVRAALEDRMEKEGLPVLFEELRRVDPTSATLYGSNDKQRIIRALEVFHNTGVALSASHSQDPDNPQIASNLYVMSWPRPALYDRINLRTDLMARNGLIDEVGNYIAKGYSRENPAIKALGYRELISALDQEIPIDHAIEVMKKKSRNYAKRQETWFRAMKEARWISCEDATTCETASCFAEDWEKSTG